MFTQGDVLNNMGGIVSAWFVYDSDVESFSRLIDTHEAVVTLKGGKQWTQIFIGQNAEVKEEFTDDDAGPLWTTSMGIRYPVKSALTTHQQRLMTGKKLIIKIQTSNNEVLYIGSLDFPASLMFGHMIGKFASDYSGYDIVLRATTPYPVLFEGEFDMGES